MQPRRLPSSSRSAAVPRWSRCGTSPPRTRGCSSSSKRTATPSPCRGTGRRSASSCRRAPPAAFARVPPPCVLWAGTACARAPRRLRCVQAHATVALRCCGAGGQGRARDARAAADGPASSASSLQGKRGIEKPPFELPDFIAATGIGKARRKPPRPPVA